MKQMLKIEIQRAFSGAAFKVSLIIGCLISTLQFMNVGIKHAMDPMKFYFYNGLDFPYTIVNTWMGAVSDAYYEVYIGILPLLVVIPYASSYYIDRKLGIINNYYIRTKRINYLIAKLVAVFLSGGVIAVLPLFINLVSTSAILPTLVWPGGSEINANAMWSDIYYSNIYLYYLLYFILEFICGGLLATIPLMISLWINNTFVLLLFPIVLCEFLNVVTGWATSNTIRGMKPSRLFSMTQLAINYWQSYVLFILIIIFLDVVMYMWRGVKHDTL